MEVISIMNLVTVKTCLHYLLLTTSLSKNKAITRISYDNYMLYAMALPPESKTSTTLNISVESKGGQKLNEQVFGSASDAAIWIEKFMKNFLKKGK